MARKSLALALAAVAIMTTAGLADEAEIGAPAPDFRAVTTDGETITLEDFADSKVTVLCFTCNQCPVAVAYEDRFIEFTKDYADQGVSFVAINVNTTEDLDQMRSRAEEKGFNFPYAYDESGESCHAYGAKVTPHIFILNEDHELVYRGSFDDSQRSPETNYASQVVDALLSGEEVPVSETDAFGCGIRPRRQR